MVRRNPVSACRCRKFVENWSDGTSSIAGLKMPLSGMVENTHIIQIGNSQTTASGTITAWSTIVRLRRTEDFDLTPAPSPARD